MKLAEGIDRCHFFAFCLGRLFLENTPSPLSSSNGATNDTRPWAPAPTPGLQNSQWPYPAFAKRLL